MADLIPLIRFVAMDAKAILFGVNGNCAQPQFGASPEDAHGDLAAISGHEFSERRQEFDLRGGFCFRRRHEIQIEVIKCRTSSRQVEQEFLLR